MAIALWEEWSPHLIWMDMRMPVMDGYEATRRIKAHLQGQATVIIALTAIAFDEARVVCLSAGCDDFVSKPIQEQVVLDKLTQHLGVQYLYGAPDQQSHAETEMHQVQRAIQGLSVMSALGRQTCDKRPLLLKPSPS